MPAPTNIARYAYLAVFILSVVVSRVTHSQSDSVADTVSYDDGPHVFWTDESHAVVISYIGGEFFRTDLMTGSDLTFHFAPWGDSISYVLHPQPNTHGPEIMTGVSRIIALSDIHGEYEYFVSLLQNVRVIDSAQRWIWGDGHLVIVGDVLDRGDRVTECLWLLYRLETEASAAGGAVHCLIGNHELMPLRGDLRYVNDKYLDGIARRNRISYPELLGRNSELGRWLRTKNTAIILNDILFVHGGISPALVDSSFTVSEINQRLRGAFDMPSHELLFNSRSLFLTSSLGPLWYRGFHPGNETGYGLATPQEVDDILEYFGARTIVVGHTGVDSVMSLYDHRVFAIDVPYEELQALEALLWQDGEFYRVTGSGELRQID